MSTFAEKLERVIAERELTYRSCARLIDPDNTEVARRSLRKWLSGKHTPTQASIDRVTDALGLDRGALDPDDEEESLYAVLVANLNPEKLRRALERATA
jgi:hypothetical protein